MRRFISCILVCFLAGCASANIPKYIKDSHPYDRTFFASFDHVAEVVEDGLKNFGWTIAEKVDPDIYERTAEANAPSREKILILTERRQSFAGFGFKNQRINVYIRTLADASVEVEVRYLNATSIPFKTFYSYRQDKNAQNFLDWVEKKLM